ncbi:MULTISPECIES: ATP-binding protein [Cellulomonas]|uniref:ATP-binding protein n=1 Tax=Cellulomonas TaxID=1707 RepID=UPI001FE0A0FF|nr:MULTISPECIES: ATP-binding protein [Cellulomonas]MCR6688299.1 ATP-binding protein [Cellulomonas sp.]
MGEVRDIRSASSVRSRRPETQDELVLPVQPTAARVARRWVMQIAAAAGIGGAANQTAELLTGELVANTVVHGPRDADVIVRVQVLGSILRVEVHDEGPGGVTLRRTEPTAPSGRGLALVDALAESWGTTTDGDGTLVWFELEAF